MATAVVGLPPVTDDVRLQFKPASMLWCRAVCLSGLGWCGLPACLSCDRCALQRPHPPCWGWWLLPAQRTRRQDVTLRLPLCAQRAYNTDCERWMRDAQFRLQNKEIPWVPLRFMHLDRCSNYVLSTKKPDGKQSVWLFLDEQGQPLWHAPEEVSCPRRTGFAVCAAWPRPPWGRHCQARLLACGAALLVTRTHTAREHSESKNAAWPVAMLAVVGHPDLPAGFRSPSSNDPPPFPRACRARWWPSTMCAAGGCCRPPTPVTPTGHQTPCTGSGGCHGTWKLAALCRPTASTPCA